MTMTARGLGVVAGILWLILALPLLALPFVAVAARFPPPIWLLAMPFIALGMATALITRPAARRVLIGSVGLGLVFAILAVLASRQSGVFPPAGPTLAYGAIAAVVALISAAALAPTSRGGLSRR